MLTWTSLHEYEVDDLVDSTGMYLGSASVIAVSWKRVSALPRKFGWTYACLSVYFAAAAHMCRLSFSTLQRYPPTGLRGVLKLVSVRPVYLLLYQPLEPS